MNPSSAWHLTRTKSLSVFPYSRINENDKTYECLLVRQSWDVIAGPSKTEHLTKLNEVRITLLCVE